MTQPWQYLAVLAAGVVLTTIFIPFFAAVYRLILREPWKQTFHDSARWMLAIYIVEAVSLEIRFIEHGWAPRRKVEWMGMQPSTYLAEFVLIVAFTVVIMCFVALYYRLRSRQSWKEAFRRGYRWVTFIFVVQIIFLVIRIVKHE